MDSEEKTAMVSQMTEVLDTRDKRWMFLTCMFGEFNLACIQLEGSPADTCWNIVDWFEKNKMLGSLAACLNTCFNLMITIRSKPDSEA